MKNETMVYARVLATVVSAREALSEAGEALETGITTHAGDDTCTEIYSVIRDIDNAIIYRLADLIKEQFE